MLNIQIGTGKILTKGIILFLIVFSFGCKLQIAEPLKDKIQLKFLDEFILAKNQMVEGSAVGGLSGIDFDGVNYYLVCDDSHKPRYYIANIQINNSKIADVDIQKVIYIKDTGMFLDLEAVRYDAKTGHVLLTSEGSINRNMNPLFLSVDTSGNIQKQYTIPPSFNTNSKESPKHNGTLEGLSKDVDGKGYWIAMELPLDVDGLEPQLIKTKSPVRITYIDAENNTAVKQFAYYLEPIAKIPLGDFSVNGLTDILQYDKNSFLIIERSYSSGLGNQGNTVKIFKARATNSTNTLNINSLKVTNYKPAKKELLLDFESLRYKLTNHSIDNIEGITFGPILPNGNRSLILVSDNNFNQLGEQLNQFILLEIID